MPIPPLSGSRSNGSCFSFRFLRFPHEVARRYAELRSVLMAQGKPVRSRALDLFTAATAIEHGPILVTQNTRDYEDIPGRTLD